MTAPKPCHIQGVDYPSRAAAARALKVPTSWVQRAIREGLTNNIGIGQGRKSWSKKTLQCYETRSIIKE